MAADQPTSILRGAFLTTSMRWIDRLIGLVSTLVLARILVPEDFGIIAMASIVVGLLDILVDLGVQVALIQNRSPSQADYDTAWTVRLLQNLLIATLIVITSPLAADFFGDPRVAPVLQVMSFGLVLAGLENIGVVRFQKSMQFGLDFRFAFLKRISGFVVTIAAAFLLQSYWAMVIGALAGRALGVLLSYRMDDMRPGVSLANWRPLLGFSQWMLLHNLGKHLNTNLHLFLVGRRADAATMGAYSLGNDISAMPSTELLAPVNRVLFPAFVQGMAIAGELKRLFLLAQGAQTLIAVPASVGLALVAHEAVLVLLGEKWLPAVPFIQVLALANVVHAITTAGSYVMLTLGRVREVALLEWVQVILFALLALSALKALEPGFVATLRLLTVTAGLAAAIWLLLRLLPELRLAEIAATVTRPLLASALMAGLLSLVGDMGGLPATRLLALKVSLGAAIYLAAVALMWLAAGRPAGVESYLLERFRLSRKRQAPGAG